ncbi:MAG: hypothetical protein ACI9R3_005602, partial [Verrucomicrobiales bacterium]
MDGWGQGDRHELKVISKISPVDPVLTSDENGLDHHGLERALKFAVFKAWGGRGVAYL